MASNQLKRNINYDWKTALLARFGATTQRGIITLRAIPIPSQSAEEQLEARVVYRFELSSSNTVKVTEIEKVQGLNTATFTLSGNNTTVSYTGIPNDFTTPPNCRINLTFSENFTNITGGGPASSRLLTNRHYNSLEVNRLQTISLYETNDY